MYEFVFCNSKVRLSILWRKVVRLRSNLQGGHLVCLGVGFSRTPTRHFSRPSPVTSLNLKSRFNQITLSKGHHLKDESMTTAFGHKIYWKSGVFGVLLGLAELSFVKNLNRLDYEKHKLAEATELQKEQIKNNEKVQKAVEKFSLAKDKLKETKSYEQLKDKTADILNKNDKLKQGVDLYKQRQQAKQQ